MSTDAKTISGDPTAGRALEIPALDGRPLGATLYQPEASARGTLVVQAAMAVPQLFYARFAEHLAARGIRVVTYDYRGMGASRQGSLRGDATTLRDWALLDARGVLEWVRERHPGEPVAILGHSFGGQMIGLLDELGEVDGALLVASQLGWYGHWSPGHRLALGFVWRAVVPAVTSLLGYLPGSVGLTHDLPGGVARDWARWCSHPDYLLSDEPRGRERFASFSAPTLLYSFTDDFYAPDGAVAALESRLTGTDVVHRRFRPDELGQPEIGHFGFFRQALEPTLWREAVDFLDSVFAGRPTSLPSRAPAARSWLDLEIVADDVWADLEHGR